jgi:hypothetical protein
MKIKILFVLVFVIVCLTPVKTSQPQYFLACPIYMVGLNHHYYGMKARTKLLRGRVHK